MSSDAWWLVAHLGGTAMMVGFIWTIQLLSYPMMAAVPADGFVAYEAAHTRRVTVLLAIIAPLEVVAAAGVVLFVDDVPARTAPPDGGWFGTDQIGRDVYSRVIYGARPILIVAPLATMIAIVVGISTMALGLGLVVRRRRHARIVSGRGDSGTHGS